MKLVHLEWSNIGSYGNKLQSIDFDSDGKLILLQGRSGYGKSTIINLPCLLFYGKIDKVPKADIPNRINKNGYLRGVVRVYDDEYTIIRKFAPSSVTVLKNGEDVNSIGVKDAEAYILDNIIQIPYQIFTNIVSLSAKKFKSFLNMSAEDRRQIIDRVFSLERVNDIFALIKKDMRDLGLAINADNTRIFTLTESVNKAHQELVKMSDANNTQHSEKINANNKIIKTETENIKLLTKKADKRNKEYATDYAAYQTESATMQQNTVNLNVLTEKEKLFRQDKCPTCGTSFDSDMFKELLDKIVSKKTEIEESQKQHQQHLKEVYDKLQKMTADANADNATISSCNQKITNARTNTAVLEESLRQTTEYSSIQNIIDSQTTELSESKVKLEADNAAWADLNDLSVFYSLDGVKSVVIKNYLPQLNSEIADSLEKLSFPYNLTFDSNFDAQLSSLGQPIHSVTLSDGEHARVDLAVLCSIYKILKRKYPSLNIFALDEFLSSLDKVTCAELLRFLKEFAVSMSLNIYVVSHVDMEAELFDEQLSVSKEMGFSDVEHSFGKK